MRIERPGSRRPDNEFELKLVTHLIVSTPFVDRVRRLLDPKVLGLRASERIAQWVLDYHSAYGKAPGAHIQDIYNERRGALSEGERDSIGDFLQTLSDRWTREEEPVNLDYLLDQAKAHLERRSLTVSVDRAQRLLNEGHVKEAREVLDKGRAESAQVNYRWVAPLDDPKFLASVFDSATEPLLEFSGKLGHLVGPLHRGYLLGLMAFTKRGKTWMMQELARQAMTKRLRVAWASLEMRDEHFAPRLYHQLGAFGEPGKRDYHYPVFDCLHNQDNSCGMKGRACRVGMPASPLNPTGYRACTRCRNDGDLADEYLPGTWWEVRERPPLERQAVAKVLKGFRRTFGRDLFRLVSYPEYSANVRDFRQDLDELESAEGFVPDVVVVDYADLFKPDDPRLVGRDIVNGTWLMMKNLASTRSVLLITVTQTNRASAERELLKESDTAEDIRKLQHVDVMLSLNQTDKEHKAGVMRIGVMEHRWRHFSRRRLVMVTQQLEVGQPILDEEIVDWSSSRRKKSEEEKEDE